MNIGTACGIFYNINSDRYTDEEKAMAIYQVMNMATHNGIKKDAMIDALKWLWHSVYEFDEQLALKPQTNFDRIKAMSVDDMATVIYNGISSDPCDYCEHNNAHCTGEFCKDKANVDIIAEWLESEVTGT